MATDDSDDDALGRLVRNAGPRPLVAEDRSHRVRAAVHSEWKGVVRRRAIRRRVMTVASLAAGVAAIAVAGRLAVVRPIEAPASVVAVVEHLDGTVTRGGGQEASGQLAERDGVHSGEWLQTGGTSRVSLRLSDGSSVRLDAGTRVRPVSARVLELDAGAVYIDTAADSARLEVRTPLGIARDIGTQFELRLQDGALRLRVRSGVVELADSARSVSGMAGTEVVWSGTDIATRPFPPHGPEWDWTAAVAPVPDIEGVPLATFLQHVAREQGWTVRYGDPRLERHASEVVLHGSVRGLSPREAVEVAVTTSGLQYQLDRGQLVVVKQANQE